MKKSCISLFCKISFSLIQHLGQVYRTRRVSPLDNRPSTNKLHHCGKNQTLDKAIGEHFSLPGHSVSDLSITVIEQSKKMIICIQKKDKGLLQKEKIFGWVSFILCA